MPEGLKRGPLHSYHGLAIEKVDVNVWRRMIIRENADLETVRLFKLPGRSQAGNPGVSNANNGNVREFGVSKKIENIDAVSYRISPPHRKTVIKMRGNC
jgi:hypothetical protein